MQLTLSDIGKRVSFEIHGSSIIGGTFVDVEVLAILGASAALEYDPRQKHDAIYSLLPEPRPQSHTEYSYYLVQMSNNQKTIVGDAWIKQGTLVRGSSSKVTVVVSDVSPSDVGKIRYLLREAGYTVDSAAINTK